MVVQLGRVIAGAQRNDILGISDRATIIDYLQRGIELVAYKANWNPWLATIDLCCSSRGHVTLPYFVGTVLACNVSGMPAFFRNSWYEFNVNGFGSQESCGAGAGWHWDDQLWTPTFEDLTDWSYLAAICEDPIDGNGSLSLVVQGDTMDQQGNQKQALTIPVSGPSMPGVKIPILAGFASTDAAITAFKNIRQVTKPVTRGYIKLIGFTDVQLNKAKTIGYYSPNETDPRYRRIRVNAQCAWVRVRYRRNDITLVNDYDIVPIESYDACLGIIKAVRLKDTNNYEESDKCLLNAVTVMRDIQAIQNGPASFDLQVDPSFGIGSIDFR